MWKTLGKTAVPIIKECLTLTPESVLQQQVRTTFILKRRIQPLYHKNGSPPKKLRSRQYIYDLVKDTNVSKQPNIDIILTTYVSGLGNIGDQVNVKPNYAYNNLLLPGLAVYATPENLDKFKDYTRKGNEVIHSSPTALRTISCLSRVSLCVSMNKITPWTVEPWHIKASFRKCGYHVPAEAIQIPDKPISGPNLDLQNKEFFITVTVNNTETVNVRCILNHWSSDVLERLPHLHDYWMQKNEAIFPEQQDILNSLPSTPGNVTSLEK